MTATPAYDRTESPKFSTDRSHYADAFRTWHAAQMPHASALDVVDIDIPVATGFSNETVFFTLVWTENGEQRQERRVARIEPTGGALFPTQTAECSVSVEVQYRAMTIVADHSPTPMPPLLGYEADPSVIGSPFFVMGHVDGVIPADNPRYSMEGFLVETSTPEERRRMVTTGLEAMAGIHAIDWRTADLGWLDASGDGNPTNATQLALYRSAITAALDGRDHPVLFAALDWLDANDPNDDRVGISWGDSRLGNILWQDHRPAAVVDWEAVALSPTEADVGWWLMFDRMSFDDMDAARMEGFPTREEMVSIYEEVSGRDVRDPHYWEVYGAMRFCMVFIGLGDRLVSADILPPEMNPAVGNMVTEALARLLEIENPTPSLIG